MGNELSKKETAVEWLARQFNTIIFYSEEAKQQTIEQAKEMEKEQIKEAFIDGKICSKTDIMSSERYYKETYANK